MFSMLTLEILIIIIFILLSLKARVKVKLMRDTKETVLSDARASKFSQALTQLVATAGGIYLSLVLLVTFLNIDVPPRVTVGKVNIEPLAGLSLFLALIQPFVLKIYYFIFRKF